MHVLATAGHVDHGKSTLVRALTGMEPDRFAEERRRGMTIDLGYAWTTLPTGQQLAFVDVPGHQRFIANMLAGLGPTPAVLFVVAADEGWSRQSAEHLAAIDALDVRHGVLAVTRSDLMEPSLAMEEAREHLSRSSLATVEAVAVSGATGAGLDELQAALGRLVDSLPAPAEAPVRLWIDRSFTIRGAGTVVTATLSSGSIAVGDQLGRPDGPPVAVRGLQSAGIEYDRLDAVARVALNLRGVPASEIARGDVLLTPGAWRTTRVLDVRTLDVRTLDVRAPYMRALEPAGPRERMPAELVLHVGTAAVAVHVRPLGDDIARLTLADALPVRAGDRAVLRDPGRQSVAAGVLVLDADPPALQRRGAAGRRGDELRPATGNLDAAAEVARRGAVTRRHLEQLGVDTSRLADVGGWLVDPQRRDDWIQRVPSAVDDWAGRHPLDPAMPRAALRHALDVPDAVLDDIVAGSGLRVAGGRITAVDASRTLGPAEVGIAELIRRLQQRPFAAPERDELVELRLGPRELAAAERVGRLQRLAGDVVLLPDAPARALRILAALAQPFTTSAARQALDTTRRVVIPLLEHLDATGVTERVDAGTRRVLDP